jgi:hypothetical protein
LRAPERHTPAFEIGFGDLAQRLVVDFLSGEQVAKAAQPDGFEPITNRAGRRRFDPTCVRRHGQP